MVIQGTEWGDEMRGVLIFLAFSPPLFAVVTFFTVSSVKQAQWLLVASYDAQHSRARA